MRLDGLNRVKAKIQHHLPGGGVIRIDRVRIGGERRTHLDALVGRLGRHEVEARLQHRVQALARGRVGAGRGQIEQLLGELVDARDLAADEAEEFIAEGGVLVVRGQQLNEGLNGDQRVADLVGHAGAEEADRSELLGVLDLGGEVGALEGALHKGGEFEQLRDLRVGIGPPRGPDADADDGGEGRSLGEDEDAEPVLFEEPGQFLPFRRRFFAGQPLRRSPAEERKCG